MVKDSHLKSQKFLIILFFVILLVSIPRFGHQTIDSIRYIKLIEFFEGKVAITELTTPFAYRILAPLLVSIMPFNNIHINFALLNILACFFAHIFIYRILVKLGFSISEAKLGTFISAISFATFNYTAAVLIEAPAFLMISMGAYFLLTQRIIFFYAVLAVGVLVKETILFLIPVYFFLLIKNQTYDFKKKLIRFFPTTMAIVILVSIRYCFKFLPGYYWTNFNYFFYNLQRPISYITVFLTLGIGIILIPIALKNKKQWLTSLKKNDSLFFLKYYFFSYFFLFMYSLFFAVMSGRFVWPLYICLIPLYIFVLKTIKIRKNYACTYLVNILKALKI